MCCLVSRHVRCWDARNWNSTGFDVSHKERSQAQCRSVQRQNANLTEGPNRATCQSPYAPRQACQGGMRGIPNDTASAHNQSLCFRHSPINTKSGFIEVEQVSSKSGKPKKPLIWAPQYRRGCGKAYTSRKETFINNFVLSRPKKQLALKLAAAV